MAGVSFVTRIAARRPGSAARSARLLNERALKRERRTVVRFRAVTHAKKARENLRASRALMVQGFPNAAASRMYYALYLAAVHALEKQGRKPSEFQDEPGYWRHEIIRSNASLVRQRSGKDRMKDSALYNAVFEMRVTADYDPASVETDQLLGRIDDVQSLVEDVT